MGAPDIVTRRPSASELEDRFLQIIDDARFSQIGPWELNENGEIVVSPVSGEHGRAQIILCSELERQIGGRAWIEQAIRRPDGPPIVPDVLWGTTDFFESHKASGLLPKPPRLCVEVVSASNAIDQLRTKCDTYLRLGAEEAWIVDPAARLVEIYDLNGRRDQSGFSVDFLEIWQRL